MFYKHLYLHHWSRFFWGQSSGINFILKLLTFRDIQMEDYEHGNCLMNEQVGRTWACLHKSTNLTKLSLFTAGSTLPKGMAYAQHGWRGSWQGWLEEAMRARHTGGKVSNSLPRSPCIIVPGSQQATLPHQSSLHGKDPESRSNGASLPSSFQHTGCRYLLWAWFYSYMDLSLSGEDKNAEWPRTCWGGLNNWRFQFPENPPACLSSHLFRRG